MAEPTMKTFSIGEQVFVARVEQNEIWLECPDCRGHKFLTVILGDESRVKIDCEACKRGHLGSTGKILSHEFAAVVVPETITKIEFNLQTAHCQYNYKDEEVIFSNPEEARIMAEKLLAEHNCAEVERLKNKERPKKSWAWNVSYHRKQIREANRQIIYHHAKL